MNIEKLIEFNNHLQNNELCGYKFHERGNVTILSTDFAIMLNFLLAYSKNFNKNSLLNFLLESQNKEGFFIDQNFSLNDTSGSHKEDYILWQFTYFSTIALDMLGSRPKYDFIFLKPLLDKVELKNWFNELNWKNFWYSSNQIMFLMYFLTYMKERWGYDPYLIDSLIQECFAILDSKQDSNTGYWGTALNRDLNIGMYGASHIYLFYDYYNRKINYPEKIIDNTLGLQNSNGLFGSEYGGACEDYDAIEILSKMLRQTDYRRKDIYIAFLKTYNKINSSQQQNGGISYCLKNFSLLEKIKKKINIYKNSNRRIYSYSGWNRMTSDSFIPDIWSTYFRTLTNAIIEKDIPSLIGTKFCFYNLPGWGYYSKEKSEKP